MEIPPWPQEWFHNVLYYPSSYIVTYMIKHNNMISPSHAISSQPMLATLNVYHARGAKPEHEDKYILSSSSKPKWPSQN